MGIRWLKAANFWIRTLSALVLAPLSLWIIWLGHPFNLFLASVATIIILYEWIKLSRHHEVWLVGGLVYLILAMTGLSVHLLNAHPYFFLGLLLMTWSTDISAYFAGSLIGGPKLAPSISPNKTWSGALGGLIFGTLAGVFIFSFLYSQNEIHPVTVLTVAIFVILAQFGDLLESWAKRCLGVKDSSNLIPGHGGLLDRLDSLIAIGFFLFFLEICSEHSLIIQKLSSWF